MASSLSPSSSSSTMIVPTLTTLDATLATSCVSAVEVFTTASTAHEAFELLQSVEMSHLTELPRGISIKKMDASNQLITSLHIDFFENRLVTHFNGVEKSVKLSNALSIICDLSEIFSKIQASAESEKNEITMFVAFNTEIQSDVKLTIDGKDVIAFYPLEKRVVLSTTRGQSSMPLSMIQNLAHLFNREFAKEICPLIGLDPSPRGLYDVINKVYLGRCLLGLKSSIEQRQYSPVTYAREINRIFNLIKMPGSDFFKPPIA